MSPSSQWLTLALMILIVALVIGSDVWLVHTRGVNATYSRVLAYLFDRYPVVLATVLFGLGGKLPQPVLALDQRLAP